MEFKCPVCQKPVPSWTSRPEGRKQINAPFFPFCSERCRLVDLGVWLDGGYRLEAEQTPSQQAHED